MNVFSFSFDTQDVDEGMPDFANMTEEEQIAFAMQMSMQDHGEFNDSLKNQFFIWQVHFTISTQTEDIPTQQAKRPKQEESPMDVDEVISDPEFLQSVLENLPGVDPQSETIRDAVGSLNKDKKPSSGDKSKK